MTEATRYAPPPQVAGDVKPGAVVMSEVLLDDMTVQSTLAEGQKEENTALMSVQKGQR